MAVAMIAGASTIEIEQHHPVEWLRGKRTIELAITPEEWEAFGQVRIGDTVKLVSYQVPNVPCENCGELDDHSCVIDGVEYGPYYDPSYEES